MCEILTITNPLPYILRCILKSYIMKLKTTLLLLLCAFYLQAQKEYATSAPQTYIYEITTEEADTFYQKSSYSFQPKSWHFHTLRDSILHKTPTDFTKSGHYIFVSTIQEDVTFELRSINTISAEVLNNKRDLNLQILDSQGNATNKATVLLNKKSIPFDTKTNTYRLPKKRTGGLLHITLNEETIFYDVSRDNDTWRIVRRWRRFVRTPIGRFINTPYRWGKRSFSYVRGVIRNGNWRIYNWQNMIPFYRLFTRDRAQNGYIVLNKPKYQIGDTVKIKAYIAKPNGKPIKKEQRLAIRKRQGSKTYFSQKLEPSEKGNFTHEFVLGDSLTLDSKYNVNWGNNLSTQFYLEDYQLDEVTWNFTSEKEKYAFADKVILKAEGKDSNGNTIPDGDVKITLKATSIKATFDSLTQIPDTLWTFQTQLKARDETKIIVPDSIFPAAKMSVTAIAEFQNSNGELEEKTISFEVSKKQNYFTPRLSNGSLSVLYHEKNKIKKAQGQVFIYAKDNQLLEEKTVDFPVQEKVNTNANYYIFQVEEAKKTVLVKELKSGITANGKSTPDSVFIDFSNPHQVEIQYLVRHTEKVVAQGKTSESNFTYSHKSSPNKTWFVDYTYIWAGDVVKEATSIRGYKKLLNIDVNQAAKVLPGEASEVKIKVRDLNGKPTANVNLTAAAINAQFKEKLPYEEPKLSYKNARFPFDLNEFTLKPKKSYTRKKSQTEEWYNTFHLDSIFYYKMRWENEGGLITYDTLTTDTFAKNMAQFTPHLIKNGRSEPIYMIYCNRKLVWYYDTDNTRPDAFVGREGYNKISVRTRDFEYTIDSVLLKKGYKTELILDLEKYGNASFAKNVSRTSMSTHLTHQEKKLIENSIFQFRSQYSDKKIFLWQNDESIHVLESSRHSAKKVGPFTNGYDLHFLKQERFYNTFKFESGYAYDVLPNRERLYSKAIFSDTQKKVLLNARKTMQLGEYALTSADIEMRPEREMRLSFGYSNFEDAESNGKLQINLSISKDTSLFFILLQNNVGSVQRAFSPNTSHLFSKMPAGDYRVSYFTKNGYRTDKTVNIQAHTTSWLNWKNPVFVKDSTGLAATLSGYQEGQKKESISKEAFSFYQAAKTGIIGQVTAAVSKEAIENAIVTAYVSGTPVSQAETDKEGNYKLLLAPGHYLLVVESKKSIYKGNLFLMLNDSTFTIADWVLDNGNLGSMGSGNVFWLSEVQIIDYKIPLIEQDNTTMGTTVTAEEIRNLPKRKVNDFLLGKISGVTAGASRMDKGDGVSIRGSRSDGTFYYVDGIRLYGNTTPDSYAFSLRDVENQDLNPYRGNKFRGNRNIFGTLTDGETDEVIPFANIIVYKDGIVLAETMTDLDGSYSFTGLPGGMIDIEFQYIGYTDTKISGITNGGRIDGQLSSGVELLESIVVAGYGISNGKVDNQRTLNLNADTPDEEPLTGTQLRTEFKDYAYWQPNLMTDQNGEAYFTAHYPDNITSWKTYVLGMDKKRRGGVAQNRVKSFKPLSAQLALPRFLIEGDKTKVIGKSINYTDTKYDIKTEFLLDKKSIQIADNQIDDAIIESTELTAPKQDSLTLTYMLSTEKYGDGEERSIPIFKRGTEETIGDFHLLQGDTSVTLNFNPDFGNVNLRAENDALSVLLKDLEYLRNYQYGCNEQTASKLTALLLEKEINAKLKRPFEHEKELITCVVRLKKNQNENGSWGWWANNAGDTWMTTYVLRALSRADAAGYKTEAYEFGLRWVTNNLDSWNDKTLLSALEMFSDIGQNMNFEPHLARLDTVNIPMFEHLTEVKIRQAQGLEYTLDSLQKYERETIFGGIYWGESRYHWQNNDLQLTRLAYEIFRGEKDTDKQRSILQFFMEKRGKHYGRHFGRNTFEIAQILSLLLPEVLAEKESEKDLKNSLSVNDMVIDEFPFEKEIAPSISMNAEKTGAGTLFFTAYQTQFNPNPEAKSDLFVVNTKMLQDGKKVDQLEQGKKVILEVTIDITKEADYVMIEVPIPAGCSYGNKAQNGYKSVEVHREYFKEKTSIFCRQLTQGTYTFTIELEPRFSGDYTLNPAKVEQMYFPVFHGRNGVKEVKID